MEFITYTLPNGIRCILKQVKSAVVHCALTVNTGSRDELPGEYGMAHLVEHTLFKGTQRRKAWQVNCRLENMGGELNAYTTKEETVVHATTLRGDYAKAVELIADIVFRSTFPEHEVEKEKNVIFDEINLYKDSPTDRIYDEFEDRIFDGSSPEPIRPTRWSFRLSATSPKRLFGQWPTAGSEAYRRAGGHSAGRYILPRNRSVTLSAAAPIRYTV